MDDTRRVPPRGVEHARRHRGVEDQFHLVKAAVGVVEFAHVADGAGQDGQAGFLGHLAAEVVRQRRPGLHPAAGQAPQVAPVAGKGVDQKHAVPVTDHGTDGKAGRGGDHAASMAAGRDLRKPGKRGKATP